ncbi:MAG TPA: c-type cytochrome [Burkholderiales bacterium]|nr:c-type cytochrome [Burkholderiales bacterium]
MKRPGKVAAWLAGLTALAAAGGGAFVYSGVYDIAATEQHTKAVYWLMDFTMRRSIAVRADESATPDMKRPEMIESGSRLYQAHCVQCHGGPGVSPDGAALGMTPVPGYLVPTAREWTAAQLHWVVKHGIKMTGMPAWKYRMSDEEIWQVVAFVKERLPYVTPVQYRDMVARMEPVPERPRPEALAGAPQGDARAGMRAMDQYACATCHVIPGITGATKHVGPPLEGMASRSYIAGVLENSSENMVRWIMWPQRVSPITAMPDLGVTEQDARDMTAFLATLKAK